MLTDCTILPSQAQQLHRSRIRLATIELIQSLLEQHTVKVIRRRFSKQGETGPKFEIVGRTEDVRLRLRRNAHISAVERAGLSSLNEGQVVEYEEVSNRGKSNTK